MADKKQDESPATNSRSGSENKTSDENSEDLVAFDSSKELDANDVDAILAEDNPEYFNEINKMKSDDSLSISEFEETSREQAIADEKERWKHKGKFGQLLLKVIPFLPSLSLLTEKLLYRFFARLRTTRLRLQSLLSNGLHSANHTVVLLKDKTVGGIKSARAAYTKKMYSLRKWQRLALYGSVAGFGIAVFLGFKIYKGGYLPKAPELFIKSLSEVAAGEIEFTSEDLEPYYENLRFATQLFLVPKIVVNIKKSRNSGNNPMAAFEFLVEGVTADVMVELKDREVELRDLMFRTIEELNYDQLESVEGKKELAELLRRELNQHMVTGQIRRVLLKTAIVKP